MGDSDANHSLFYVGNSEDCVAGEEYVFPRTDGKTGTVNYVTYTAVDGSTQPLGIYLPYGYDETKTYKTLYLSHGGAEMKLNGMRSAQRRISSIT